VQKGSGKTGKLHILDWQGQPLHEVALPAAFGTEDWNGALAAPTLANIDADPDLEVVLNTAHSGFVAYDLPGTARARILWGTGRGNYQRTGTAVPGPLPLVTITATDSQATEPGTDRGRFRLTRTGSTAAALAVRLIVTGSATSNMDYQQLATTRNIPAGLASVSLGVVVHDDTDTEGNETVSVRIAASDAYRVGVPAVAQVNILDND
jgi:hypothetical protein